MTNPNDTSMGTISLILGILGCIGVVPCIGSIIAIICGYMANGTAGESNGKWGRRLGWFMVCVSIILGILIPVGIFVLGWFGY